jgi:hypothetical protein
MDDMNARDLYYKPRFSDQLVDLKDLMYGANSLHQPLLFVEEKRLE